MPSIQRGKAALYVVGLTLLFIALAGSAAAQSVELIPAPRVVFPADVDSNSPASWNGREFFLYNSTGLGPIRSSGLDQFRLSRSQAVLLGPSLHKPYWIEATWTDPDGTVLAWYHHEPPNVCPGSTLTSPEIGALASRDGGRSFMDLGIILKSGYPIDCSSQNGYFAGGHGDFSVLLSRNREYFYFLFSSYSGPAKNQGVVAARLPYWRRLNPFGAVEKYFEGEWQEPGTGGRVTPIFPAAAEWQRAEADAFWGPSVHWNSYLRKYVMLLNRSCCSSGWPQEGVYVSFNESISQPEGWSSPVKILGDVWWYPQVLGGWPNGTDKLAGRVARLYVYGVSDWEIVFHRQASVNENPPPLDDSQSNPLEPQLLPDDPIRFPQHPSLDRKKNSQLPLPAGLRKTR